MIEHLSVPDIEWKEFEAWWKRKWKLTTPDRLMIEFFLGFHEDWIQEQVKKSLLKEKR